jgi:hypothetical protein
MLQNPFYMGFVRYKGQLIPGKHPALVDRELFETAQKVRQQLRRVHGAYPHKIRFFLFSGLIRCANCGFVMRGRTYKRNEKEERQYVDTGHEHSVQCQQSLVKADNIERQIVAHIRRIRLPKPWIERIIQLTTATEKTQHEERSRMALRSRLDRLQRLFVDGDLTEASYEQERAKVAKQMAQLPVETTTAPKIRALANNMGALWEKMTNLERQTVLNHLFRGIYIRGNTIERVEPRKAFKELFE